MSEQTYVRGSLRGLNKEYSSILGPHCRHLETGVCRRGQRFCGTGALDGDSEPVLPYMVALLVA